MRWLRHPAVYWVVSMGLGAVFIYASLDKIAHPLDFARIVYRYRLAGPSATLGVVPANAFALILPWLEAIIGVLLVLAGLGYMVDKIGSVLVSGYSLEISRFSFVGEAVLIFWLLIKGVRLGVSHTQRTE